MDGVAVITGKPVWDVGTRTAGITSSVRGSYGSVVWISRGLSRVVLSPESYLAHHVTPIIGRRFPRGETAPAVPIRTSGEVIVSQGIIKPVGVSASPMVRTVTPAVWNASYPPVLVSLPSVRHVSEVGTTIGIKVDTPASRAVRTISLTGAAITL